MDRVKHLESKFSIASYELIRDCDPSELRFYLWLKLWAINKNSAWPSLTTISADLGLSRQGVVDLIERMEKSGRLAVTRKARQNNIYDITWYDNLANRVVVKKVDQGSQESGLGGSQESRPQLSESINEEKVTMSSKEDRGNPYVQGCYDFLKEEIGGFLDGSEKENRRYCWLLLSKLKVKDDPQKAADGVKWLIRAARDDPFHAKNCTSFKYLYYNASKIHQATKQNKWVI